jgi:hypothetical protein
MFADLSMPWRAYAIADVVAVVAIVLLNLWCVVPPIVHYLRTSLDDEDVERARYDTLVRMSESRKERTL